MKIKRLAATLLTCTVLVACGGDSTGPDDPGNELGGGQFTAEVTGALNASLEGLAFIPADGTEQEGFGIVLAAQNAGAGIVLASDSGVRPGKGTHTIADITVEDDAGYAAIFTSEAGLFGSTGGTLTITASSEDRLQGTFEFTALGGAEDQASTITIEGSFDARSCTRTDCADLY